MNDADADLAAELQHLLGDGGPKSTDRLRAKLFVDTHGADIRFCAPWDKWLIWDQTRWKIDDSLCIERMARDFVADLHHQAAEARTEKTQTFLGDAASALQSRTKRVAMIADARSFVPVLPSELDRDIFALNCTNGTLDLRTGELRGHRREDLITRRLDLDFDAKAQCPRWLAFVEEIFGKHEELIEFVHRAVGYSLTGATGEHVIFIQYGTGANGKTTLDRAVQELMGDYARQAAPDLLVTRRGERHPCELAELHGARLVVASESGQGRRLREDLVKQLTGDDWITARRMRENFWTFPPTHKIWLATNHRPRIKGTDEAIWRRIRLIPFSVQFHESGKGSPEKDTKLSEALRAELPGILAWAVQGSLAWGKEGLGTAPEIALATASYRAEEDMLGLFLDDCTITRPDAQTKTRELYARHSRWCDDNGERPLSQKAFGDGLRERGFNPRRDNQGDRCWHGIGLVADVLTLLTGPAKTCPRCAGHGCRYCGDMGRIVCE